MFTIIPTSPASFRNVLSHSMFQMSKHIVSAILTLLTSISTGSLPGSKYLRSSKTP